MSISYFKNRKVLVMGLGTLRGGAEAAKWFARHGAKVTVTDLKKRKELESSIRSLGKWRRRIDFVLGKHQEKDFRENEIIVVNPAVPRESKFLKIAEKSGARLENEASIFFRFCKNPVVGITGTRGKTTTANWIYHILKKKYPRTVLTGNSSENPMLSALDRLDGKNPVVVELSSWHLELLPRSGKSPHVAVITNIYPDHLNRYRDMEDYASAKANIFKYQTTTDFLVLNRRNNWTKFFLKLRPKSKTKFFSATTPLRVLHDRKAPTAGTHNFENLNAAVSAVRCFGVPGTAIQRALRNLPPIPFRQEIILKNRNLTVVNDTTATTPEATIAALERFGRLGKLILIAGGTDKKLDFSEWAKTVGKYVKPNNLFLLNGNATRKMISALRKIGYFKNIKPQLFESLSEMVRAVRNGQSGIVIFSPGGTSFEKFQNEFDRGRQFNRLVKLYF